MDILTLSGAGEPGFQFAVLDPEPITLSKDGAHTVICRDDPATPVEMDDTEPPAAEQPVERDAQGLGAEKGLAHAAKLAHVGQQAFDQLQARGIPGGAPQGSQRQKVRWLSGDRASRTFRLFRPIERGSISLYVGEVFSSSAL